MPRRLDPDHNSQVTDFAMQPPNPGLQILVLTSIALLHAGSIVNQEGHENMNFGAAVVRGTVT